MEEDEKPCPVCGNEERHGRTRLLTCECPEPKPAKPILEIKGLERHTNCDCSQCLPHTY